MRPRRFRQILQEPQFRCFEPHSEENNEKCSLIEVTLDEFEAIRLRDYNSAKQKKAAKDMEISQPTFHRILTSGRKKNR